MPKAKSRPMSVLGWEIATTLPSQPGAAKVTDLVEDCICKPWIAEPRKTLPMNEARKLVRDVIAHEVRPFVSRLAGLESLVVLHMKKGSDRCRYALSVAAQRRVTEEFEKIRPTFSGKRA